MTVFEPLLLLLVAATVVALSVAGAVALGGNRRRATRIVRRLGSALVLYVGVVIAVSAVRPRAEYRIGQEQCYDDWCITITDAARATPPGDTTFVVGVRLANRARRRPMGERGTSLYLVDARGRRIDPVPRPDDVGFDTILPPGGDAPASRTFIVPRDASPAGVVYAHDRGFPIGWFIIGADGWFAEPPIVRLSRAGR